MHATPRVLVGPAVFAASMLCLAASVEAHNWGCWRQPNRTVYAYNTAVLNSQANAALSEWDTKTVLAVPRVNYHTEISVFDGYYGNTGWAGLASIESASGCNILHGHARVNRSYSYTSNGYRGIFCQEVGHLFGLDHSNDGGCMGGGYYYNINTYYTVVQHNINDIASKYSGVPLAPAAPEAIASEPSGAAVVPAAFGGTIPEGQTRAIAFWNERPNTLEEARALAEAVVSARVIEVRRGPDLVVPVPGLDDNVDRIPTQRVLFSVEKVLSGAMKGRVFELFQTGNDEFTVAEDPPYVSGERYVLFLTTKERGTYRVIAPEGRLKISSSGLAPSSTREFMSDLTGRTVEALAGDLAKPASSMPQDASGLQLRRNATPASGAAVSISYALPQASSVKLRIYDVQGRLVRTLVDGPQEGPRWYTLEWDGEDHAGRTVASGVFYARLETSAGMKTLSIAIVR
ncbi:MAG TPA: FlgD immunoglobulin-like domain containing protein [Candidatus Eisenbacteria bacterium]|nr:FlgD immunoglobulin-like domain containing protein [Candidatus Eisenbacteria bacterium]